MKYRNVNPKDPISKLLQFSVDYEYVRHNGGQVSKEARLLYWLINLGIFVGLCLLIALV